MADDIVTRLRDADCECELCWDQPPFHSINRQAADEIVRLRAALAVASGIISTLPPYEDQHPEAVMEMLLEEARRG